MHARKFYLFDTSIKKLSFKNALKGSSFILQKSEPIIVIKQAYIYWTLS